MIFAIDPGTRESGWAELGPDGLFTGKESNVDMLLRIHGLSPYAVVAIERFACYGMTIGQETIDAIEWAGMFRIAAEKGGRRVLRVFRKDVKMAITGSPKANDAAIRQALIDMYGGKEKAIGKKGAPGPLNRVRADGWAALAIAWTVRRGEEQDFQA